LSFSFVALDHRSSSSGGGGVSGPAKEKHNPVSERGDTTKNGAKNVGTYRKPSPENCPPFRRVFSFFLSLVALLVLRRHVCLERCSIFGDARSRGGQREERNARRWEELLETNDDGEKKFNGVDVVVENGGRRCRAGGEGRKEREEENEKRGVIYDQRGVVVRDGWYRSAERYGGTRDV